ncbi:MAG: hypothetical protein ACLP1X_19760 [Polyangiaceae bacterium]
MTLRRRRKKMKMTSVLLSDEDREIIGRLREPFSELGAEVTLAAIIRMALRAALEMQKTKQLSRRRGAKLHALPRRTTRKRAA